MSRLSHKVAVVTGAPKGIDAQQIRVNGLNPGLVETEGTRTAPRIPLPTRLIC